MATTIETLTSVCNLCEAPIGISIVVGEQKWRDVDWTHLNEKPGTLHRAIPELRFVIDATCPGCDYPEIGFAPARDEFVCSRCGHTQDTRPEDDDVDPSPC